MEQISYVFEAYPNEKQKFIINNIIGTNRYFYNRLRQHLNKKILKGFNIENRFDIMTYVNDVSINKPFIKDCDKSSLMFKGMDLIKTFRNNNHDPIKYKPAKFKRKKDHELVRILNYNNFIKIIDDKILLPKIGRLKLNISREIPETFIIQTVIIEKYAEMKYFVNICLGYERKILYKKLDFKKSIGLDFSVGDFYVDSNGNTPNYPFRKINKLEKRINKLKNKTKKMIKGSNNHIKTKNKVISLRIDLQNLKKDSHFKIASKLVKEYDYIFFETLKLSSISSKNNTNNGNEVRLGVRCSQINYTEFIKILKHQAKKHSKIAHSISKYEKTSQKCSFCGYLNPIMKDFSIRTYICQRCNKTIDRDYNAAINIKNAGVSELNK